MTFLWNKHSVVIPEISVCFQAGISVVILVSLFPK